MPVDQHYRIRDVTEKLGVSKRTVWNWIHKGLLRTVRLSGPKGPHFISETDLAEFVKSRSWPEPKEGT